MNLVCTTCSSAFSANEPRWRCHCGGVLDLGFTLKIDPGDLSRRPFNLWRYREAIPVDDDKNIISFREGGTPLFDCEIDDVRMAIKLDYLFPSGSFKDRGASVLVSKVKELGIKHVVEDSSGNAGAAIAAYCASAGIGCDIYVPDSTSPNKLVQIEMMGATLHKIPGSREDTARAVLAAAEKIYYASHSWNPFFLHGVKTVAYEIAEQMAWATPDVLVLPVGNGTLLLGAYLGFKELWGAGVIPNMPKLIAVQAENCAPCAAAFLQEKSKPVVVEKKPTLAEGIAVAEPIRGKQILAAVRETGGQFVTVSEAAIAFWLKRLYQQGLYVEPTAAVAFAGLAALKKSLSGSQKIVIALTGHGLKANKKI